MAPTTSEISNLVCDQAMGLLNNSVSTKAVIIFFIFECSWVKIDV